MKNMDKYQDQIERAITMFYMRVLNRFPVIKDYENKIVRSYIDLLTKQRERHWRERALPDFIIIGGMKCGTSSLFKYLGQHPQLYSSNYKELRYFSHDEYYFQGEKWYRTKFPKSETVPEDALVFEASPDYLHYSKAPMRMVNLLPDIKLIALLRNPTERAISHYFHDLKKGRRQDETWKVLQDEKSLYMRRGRYKDQLGLYYKSFKPENILIINSERLFEDTAETLKKIYQFLEIDPNHQISDLSPKQVGYNREPVDAAVYDYLNDYYRPFNQELYELIGEDFEW